MGEEKFSAGDLGSLLRVPRFHAPCFPVFGTLPKTFHTWVFMLLAPEDRVLVLTENFWHLLLYGFGA